MLRRVHECGYDPPAEALRMAGGAADPLMQDTDVDLAVMHALLADAHAFVTRAHAHMAGGRGGSQARLESLPPFASACSVGARSLEVGCAHVI